MRKNKPRAGIAFYLGIIIFFYFGFDLFINDYPWPEMFYRGMAALAGLFLPVMGKIIFKR